MTPVAEIVIPTVGRPSLAVLLDALASQDTPWCAGITVVDDRATPDDLLLPRTAGSDPDLTVVRSGGRGPAAARNAGLAHTRAPWVVFLDDDLVPATGWAAALRADLAGSDADTAAVRGVVVDARGPDPVRRDDASLPEISGPTPDADLAYRRDALVRVGGFDERLAAPRHEHAEVALRLRRNGAGIATGRRVTVHTPPPSGPRAIVAGQRYHRDDARMRWEHGRHWRRDAAVGRSRIRRHLVTTATGIAAGIATATGHRRAAVIAAALWLAMSAEPRRPPERVGLRTGPAVLATVVVPPAAVYHRIRGELAVRKVATP